MPHLALRLLAALDRTAARIVRSTPLGVPGSEYALSLAFATWSASHAVALHVLTATSTTRG